MLEFLLWKLLSAAEETFEINPSLAQCGSVWSRLQRYAYLGASSWSTSACTFGLLQSKQEIRRVWGSFNSIFCIQLLSSAVSKYQNPKIGIFSSLPFGLLSNTACSSSSVKASLSNWRIHSRAKTSFAQCGSLWFRHCVWSFSSFSAFSSFSCIFRHGFASIQSSSDPVEIRRC